MWRANCIWVLVSTWVVFSLVLLLLSVLTALFIFPLFPLLLSWLTRAKGRAKFFYLNFFIIYSNIYLSLHLFIEIILSIIIIFNIIIIFINSSNFFISVDTCMSRCRAAAGLASIPNNLPLSETSSSTDDSPSSRSISSILTLDFFSWLSSALKFVRSC